MFSVKCGLIAITRGDTGLITVEPKDGYTPTPKDRAIFTVAEMPGAKTVISKVVTPDESGVVRIPLMSVDTDDLPKDRQREYTWSLRYALDAVMTGDAVTGWREMITPIPAGQFVVLEANDFPSGVSCPEDERLPVKIESLKGERGEQGERGERGEKGEKGDRGEKGERGERGIQGARGEKGDALRFDDLTIEQKAQLKGERGERGERGEKGEKGDRGEKGERGERGIQGARGEKGDALRFDDLTIEQKAQLKGERGERGEKGEQGERGERGMQGIQGATGAQGRQGDTGLRGAKGDPFVYADFTPEQLAALKGEPGRDGAPGEPGKDAPQEAVLYTAQTLDEAQKAQARENLGAADAARQNILVGSETGNPIAVDDAFAAPLRGLTVYGKSTQDGTPSPDNPVPIVSAGDGGTIAVTLSGENGKTQTLTLHTPDGLASVPAMSAEYATNYIDSNGKFWVCDEIDLVRGVRVQRVETVDITADGNNITGNYELGKTRRLTIQLGLPAKDYRAKSLCNRCSWAADFSGDYEHLYTDTYNAFVFIPVSAALPQQGEYIISYALATPIETPLTPAEIAAYKALTTYAPDTVVQASDGAGIKLEYQRDVNIAIKKLEDAIASMTTT